MPKGTEKERIVGRQSTTMIIVALISSVTTLLVTVLTAILTLPPFHDWLYSLGNSQSLEVEQTSPRVFAYYGEAEHAGGFGRLELIFDDDAKMPVYELAYTLPNDKNGYAGMAFQFGGGLNLSEYAAAECMVTFSQADDVVDLYFKDIAGHFNTVRVTNNGADEMRLRLEFANFSSINFNAVKEFGVVISTDFSTGSHTVQIQNVHFTP